MKANELRIGNFVWEEYGGLYEVLMISPNYVDLVKPFMSVSGRYDIETIKPIPLTEEWLLKFGFKEKIKNTFSSNQEVSFNIYSRGNFTFNTIQGLWWWKERVLDNQIKYVHQLQNLYFAIIGEELTIGGQE